MRASKARDYPSEEPLSQLKGRLLDLPTNNTLDLKGLPWIYTLAYYKNL
jgi:hypothetical protein